PAGRPRRQRGRPVGVTGKNGLKFASPRPLGLAYRAAAAESAARPRTFDHTPRVTPAAAQREPREAMLRIAQPADSVLTDRRREPRVPCRGALPVAPCAGPGAGSFARLRVLD